MKNLINIIFPFKMQLNIIQLEEYKPIRFLKWFLTHPLKRHIPNKKELVITTKVKIIIFLSNVWLVIIGFLASKFSSFLFTILLILFLLLNPFILFLLALISLFPYEFINKIRVIKKTKNKIKNIPNLKVIAITGSYGKTTTKEILYQLLKSKYRVLRTPESYNTIFGIAKVVDLELNTNYQFFIAEIGAYKKGEIRTLCKMLEPSYGIITGITEQHLERFKSLRNIISTKFELFDFIKDPKKMVFNIEDKKILKELNKRGISYKKRVSVDNIKFNKQGTSFTIIIDNKKFRIKSQLFGYGNIQNIRTASEAALTLGFLRANEIVESLKKLQPFHNRFVLRNAQNTTIIDNTYNTSYKAFEEMIRTAKELKGKKALITPGIVELGKTESKKHEILGRKSRNIFDTIVLVGKNKRTLSFSRGIGNKQKVMFIEDNRTQYNQIIQSLINKSYDWIFLENDITQNY